MNDHTCFESIVTLFVCRLGLAFGGFTYFYARYTEPSTALICSHSHYDCYILIATRILAGSSGDSQPFRQQHTSSAAFSPSHV